jgi:hypothetical protein
VPDVAQDVADLATEEDERDDREDRDESEDQRVLRESLAVLIADEERRDKCAYDANALSLARRQDESEPAPGPIAGSRVFPR